jgi:hypothetical protein
VSSTFVIKNERGPIYTLTFRTAILLGFIFFTHALLVNAQFSVDPQENTMIVEDAPEMEVIAYGKNVIVRGRAKGVLSIGGDVTVEGRVEGDVAAVGGSIYQKDAAFIGGDVFVLGGKYKPDSAAPLRTEGKETVMFGVYEEELRELTQNPSRIFAPSFSLTFLAWRVISVLFWFIVTLALATIAPGAVSRAITRFKLSTLKVVGLGFTGLILTTIAVIASLNVLPSELGAVVSLMTFALLLLAYLFGRVALQVSTGQVLQRQFLSEGKRSETLAILIGVVVWTIVLSLPYIWTLAVVALFSAGIGLVFTARSKGLRITP